MNSIPMLWLRSALFEVVRIPLVVTWSLLSLLTWPLPLRYRYLFISQWARMTLAWLRITCGVRWQVRGLENIPSDTPVVVMCKHQSAWETLYLQRLFVPQAWVLKRELLWLPAFGWALALTRPIAINRGDGRQAIKQVMVQGKERLDDGETVVIFPEGTRVAPGTRGTYHAGGAMLATHAGYPVLPITHNAGECWPRNGFLKYPGTVQVVIGPLMPVTGKSSKQLIGAVEAWIEDTLATLPPARQS